MAIQDALRGLLERNLSGTAAEGAGGYDPAHERISLVEPVETTYGHRLRYCLAAGLARPGDTVVDAACGTGYGRAILSARGGIRYIGVDRFTAQEVGPQPGELPGSGFVAADLEAWAPDFGVDLAVCFETLEHVDDPTVLLGWLRRARTLVLSVPIGNTGSPWHVRVLRPGEVTNWFPSMRLLGQLWQPGESSEIYAFGGPA